MCTSLGQERLVRRSQAATHWQPVQDTALYVKNAFSMGTEQGERISFSYSFYKYVLSTYYVPATILEQWTK